MLQALCSSRFLWIAFAFVAVAIAGCAHRHQVEAAPKTVRLLLIGNSFSQQGTGYLPRLAKEGGHRLIIGRAEVGGCTLEKHVRTAAIHEGDSEAPEGKIYKVKQPDGKWKPQSLKEILQSQPWDYVSMQQASWKISYETYQPYATQLAGYVARYAPQAKLVVHETWAYRADDAIYKSGKLTPQSMHEQLHANYARLAEEIGAAKIIPSGTAFDMARRDPRWQFRIESSTKGLWYPHLPRQVNSLHAGYYWITKTDPPSFWHDGHHLNTAGKYLASAVWYEMFFGDVRQLNYVPGQLTARKAGSLREIAHAAALTQRDFTAKGPTSRPVPLLPASRPATQPSTTQAATTPATANTAPATMATE